MSWYVSNSFCHACYISECIYLHIFRVSFLLKRHLSHGHEFSCLAHHLEGTVNKPFSRQIGPTHKQVGQLPIKAGWQDASLGFCNLSKAFKHNMWMQRNWKPQSLSSQMNTQPLCQTGQMIDLRCDYLFVRYPLKLQISRLFREGIPWHSWNYRVYIHFGMRTWHDNNIQDLHFPGAIKIVATMIHYCYCLIHYCYCFESEEQLYGIGW